MWASLLNFYRVTSLVRSRFLKETIESDLCSCCWTGWRRIRWRRPRWFLGRRRVYSRRARPFPPNAASIYLTALYLSQAYKTQETGKLLLDFVIWKHRQGTNLERRPRSGGSKDREWFREEQQEEDKKNSTGRWHRIGNVAAKKWEVVDKEKKWDKKVLSFFQNAKAGLDSRFEHPAKYLLVSAKPCCL